MVTELKRARDEANIQLINANEQLQNEKRHLCSLKDANDPEDVETSSQHVFNITANEYQYVAPAEDITVEDDLLQSETLVFCGTDNGIVQMTAAVDGSLPSPEHLETPYPFAEAIGLFTVYLLVHNNNKEIVLLLFYFFTTCKY
jgi:hypothetical protein